MPIYAYRCSTCGHAQDVLRKVSDPPLHVCPACGASTYEKQVTAAGFQLKGSGWYVTDFRDNKKPAKSGDAAASDAPSADAVAANGASVNGAGGDAAKPAPAPAPASAKAEAVAAPAPAAASPTPDKGKS